MVVRVRLCQNFVETQRMHVHAFTALTPQEFSELKLRKYTQRHRPLNATLHML